jgi:hypothetical protein
MGAIFGRAMCDAKKIPANKSILRSVVAGLVPAIHELR